MIQNIAQLVKYLRITKSATTKKDLTVFKNLLCMKYILHLQKSSKYLYLFFENFNFFEKKNIIMDS